MENQTQDSILDLNFTMTTKEIFNGQDIFYEGRKKYLTRINIIFVLLLFSFIGSLAYVITAINSNDPDYVFIVIYSILSVWLFILCLFYGFSVIMNIQKKSLIYIQLLKITIIDSLLLNTRLIKIR